MKIYNKKIFTIGILFCILQIFFIITSLVIKDGIRLIPLNIILLFFGIFNVIGSLSKSYSERRYLEKKDEKNQLENLKVRDKAFQLTQYFALIFGFIFVVWGVILNKEIILMLGISWTAIWSVSAIFEICTFIYFSFKNK